MAAHEEAAEGQKATTKLYESFWLGKPTPTQEEAIAASLRQLAEGYEKVLKPATYRLYTAVLADLTINRTVLAFSRAAMESRFFPSPALLRELSGQTTTGDPLAVEAKEELYRIVAAMRGPHGPKLKDIPGRVLYGTEERPLDEHGKVHHAPIRAPGTPFPLSRRTEAALIRLGWGCRTTGIALIAESPIVSGSTAEDGEYQVNRLRAADELLAKWTAAYRDVR